MQKDRILRATANRAELRFVAVDATAAATHFGACHGAKAFALGLMSETAAAALLLAAGLKEAGAVQLTLRYSGVISRVAADATPMGLVRAMIPKDEIEKADKCDLLLSPQHLSVVKTNRKGRKISEGLVQMPSSSVGPNVATYLLQSEQVKSAVGVRAKVKPSGEGLEYCVGFLVETFPKVDEKTVAIMEQVISTFDGFDDFYDRDDRTKSEYDLDGLLNHLAGPFEYTVHKEFPVVPYCPCNRNSVLRSISALGREELQSVVEKRESLELHCQFCRKRYQIAPVEIESLLKD